MNKCASVVFGKTQDHSFAQELNNCAIVFAESDAFEFVSSVLNISKSKLRTISCSEIKNNKPLAYETSCHVLAPFVDFSTYVIATSHQIKPKYLIQILNMPHICKLFYEIDCKQTADASSVIIALVKYADANKHQITVKDSNAHKISGKVSILDIISSNSFISVCLQKS